MIKICQQRIGRYVKPMRNQLYHATGTSKGSYIEILLPVEKGPRPHLLVMGVEFLRYPPKKNFLRLTRESKIFQKAISYKGLKSLRFQSSISLCPVIEEVYKGLQ